MPTDTQIVSSADHAAPKDYVLPGNAELLLKAVQATFTDNGAASAWLPAVVLISDSGHTISRALDPSVTVAAGGSAEVSWFPGVKPGAAASAGSTKIFAAYTHNAPWANSGPPGGDGVWNEIYNDDTSVFTFTNLYQDTVEVNAPGKYLITASAHWDVVGAGTNAWANAAGSIMSYAIFTTGLPSTHWAIGGLFQEGLQDLSDIQICVVPASAAFPLNVYVDGFQSSGVDQTGSLTLIVWQLDAAT